MLLGYLPAVRPVRNASHTIIVKVNFALTQILDIVSILLSSATHLSFIFAALSKEKRRNREVFGDEARLLQRLLKGYVKATRPVANASHIIVVKINFSLTQILGVVSTAWRHSDVTLTAWRVLLVGKQ